VQPVVDTESHADQTSGQPIDLQVELDSMSEEHSFVERDVAVAPANEEIAESLMADQQFVVAQAPIPTTDSSSDLPKLRAPG
jgi:hypothetical protein